jgi:hypothetical protein
MLEPPTTSKEHDDQVQNIVKALSRQYNPSLDVPGPVTPAIAVAKVQNNWFGLKRRLVQNDWFGLKGRLEAHRIKQQMRKLDKLPPPPPPPAPSSLHTKQHDSAAVATWPALILAAAILAGYKCDPITSADSATIQALERIFLALHGDSYDAPFARPVAEFNSTTEHFHFYPVILEDKLGKFAYKVPFPRLTM